MNTLCFVPMAAGARARMRRRCRGHPGQLRHGNRERPGSARRERRNRHWLPGLQSRRSWPRTRQVRLRDMPSFGRPVRLLWAKGVWHRPDPDCPPERDSPRSTRWQDRGRNSQSGPLAGLPTRRGVSTPRSPPWPTNSESPGTWPGTRTREVHRRDPNGGAGSVPRLRERDPRRSARSHHRP
jgi:hypothetical protein